MTNVVHCSHNTKYFFPKREIKVFGDYNDPTVVIVMVYPPRSLKSLESLPADSAGNLNLL